MYTRYALSLSLVIMLLFRANPVEAFRNILWGDPVHEDICSDGFSVGGVPFLKPFILSAIRDEQAQFDAFHLDDGSFHFDNCNFEDSIQVINFEL